MIVGSQDDEVIQHVGMSKEMQRTAGLWANLKRLESVGVPKTM